MLESEVKEGKRVDEGVILVVFVDILHQKRVNAAVDIDELPYLEKHWLVESDAEDDLLEYLRRLARCH